MAEEEERSESEAYPWVIRLDSGKVRHASLKRVFDDQAGERQAVLSAAGGGRSV